MEGLRFVPVSSAHSLPFVHYLSKAKTSVTCVFHLPRTDRRTFRIYIEHMYSVGFPDSSPFYWITVASLQKKSDCVCVLRMSGGGEQEHSLESDFSNT